MKQIEKRSDFLMNEKEYFRIIHQKTAALFQAACMGGAYFGGVSMAAVEALGDYGFHLGMAFQIVDDCLDILGNTESIGKTAGLDIYKSDVTLPTLYLFQSLKDAERKTLLGNGVERRPEAVEKIKRMALDTGVIDRAMEKAREFTEKALEGLRSVRECPFKDSLVQLTSFNLERGR